MRKGMATVFTILAMVGLLGLALPAAALDFDFQGNFTKDNDVVQFNFSVGAPSTVTVFSSSWLTGNPPQGFDPMLGIWTALGVLIEFQDDGGNEGTTFSNGVPYNHGVWDSYYQVALAPGSYIATVTQYNNFPNGNNLSDGFNFDGVPDFTFTQGFGGATQPFFNGVWDDNDPRTSFWQFHLLNVEEAVVVVPVPSAALLLSSGLLLLLGFRRR